MVKDSSRKRLPPYISYRTFLNFIDRLQKGVPARIDRSYLSDRLAGSTSTQLISSLRFLGLIDATGAPTSRLRLLVSAKDIKRTEVLKQMTSEAYVFVLHGSFDLQSATYAQLEDVFHNTFQLAHDVGRKCIKFFVALASDAEMALSPFITERSRTIQNITGTKKIAKTETRKIIQGKGTRTNQNLVIPNHLREIPDGLLTKFPTFDPAWSDEVKLKWFEAFDKLLIRSLDKGKK